MFSISSDVYYMTMILGSVFGTIWGLAIWLTGKFSALKGQFYDKIDKSVGLLLDKLEYHERHDDQRFAELNRDINALHIRNATADALLLSNHPTKNK
jgi:hypothetical protein